MPDTGPATLESLEIGRKVLAVVSDQRESAEHICRRAILEENEGETMTILVTLGLVCVVIGVALRAFSKSASDVSLNQRTK